MQDYLYNVLLSFFSAPPTPNPKEISQASALNWYLLPLEAAKSQTTLCICAV